MQKIKLSNILGHAYYNIHNDIQLNRHTYYNLEGGRGSLKSSFVSVEIVLGMMKDPDANALVYRKVADTLRTSVYEQVCWAINMLGVSDKWECKVSPLRCIYKATGQVILFKGLDKAKKSKSVKVARGYIKYLWFEEFDEFAGSEEIRSVQQSVLRGGDNFKVFRSMNPPRSKSSWSNVFMTEQSQREDTLNLHTTYLQAPAEWLGNVFIEEAEYIKETDPKTYDHEYLGKAIGMGLEVFDNIVTNTITQKQIDMFEFDKCYRGVDWGWYPDPFQYVACYYDSAHRNLFIYDEYRTNKQTNEETAKYLKEVKCLTRFDTVVCDSAEKKSIQDYKKMNIRAIAATKGPSSIRYGIKWLQSLNIIYIDPKRCPNVYKEFTKYQYDTTKDGEVLNTFPDCDNHSIDAVRYAMERVWRKAGK